MKHSITKNKLFIVQQIINLLNNNLTVLSVQSVVDA